MLANAGRGGEAAQAYGKAAETATPTETLELKRLESTQLLLSGHVEDGLASAHAAGAAWFIDAADGAGGLDLTSPLSILAQTAWPQVPEARREPGPGDGAGEDRIFAGRRWRGFRCRSRSGGHASRRAGFSWLSRPANRCESPGLGDGSRTQATAGAPAGARVASLLEQAERIAHEIDSAYARGMIEMVRGFAALMRGEWETARTVLEGAELLFRQNCKGVTWERDTTHNFMLRAMAQMGEIRELKAQWSVFFRESQERGDRYAAAMLTSFYMTLIKLAGNQQPETEGELEAVLEKGDAEASTSRNRTR